MMAEEQADTHPVACESDSRDLDTMAIDDDDIGETEKEQGEQEKEDGILSTVMAVKARHDAKKRPGSAKLQAKDHPSMHAQDSTMQSSIDESKGVILQVLPSRSAYSNDSDGSHSDSVTSGNDLYDVAQRFLQMVRVSINETFLF